MNLRKNWELKIDPEVYKDISKFSKNYATKIIAVILSLDDNPYVGDIKKIKGEKNTWRRRVGDYRVFYEIHSEFNLIHVLWVEHRGSKTY